MKKLTMSIMIVLAFTLLAHAGVKKEVGPGTWIFAQNAIGDLEIVAVPGISIYIDGELKGITNKEENGLIVENVESGMHSLKAKKKGYRDIDYRFKISASRTYKFRLTLTRASGTLILRSIPQGATIYIDGKKTGTTDTVLKNIAAGPHDVRFVYRRIRLSQKIELGDNESINLKASFEQNKVINVTQLEKKLAEQKKKEEEEERERRVREQCDNPSRVVGRLHHGEFYFRNRNVCRVDLLDAYKTPVIECAFPGYDSKTVSYYGQDVFDACLQPCIDLCKRLHHLN